MYMTEKNSSINAAAAKRSLIQALVYFVIGCIWIFSSDSAMGRNAPLVDQHLLLISTMKGISFVFVTAVIFFALMYSALKKIMQSSSDLEYIAYHDDLTGLYNRKYIEKTISELDTDWFYPLSVIIGDFNGLKLVNDAFGHNFADELLKLSAKALQNVCRQQDIVSRWGSGEFLILLPRTSNDDAQRIVNRLKQECQRFELNSIAVDLTFGASTKDRREQAITDVINHAENTMYDLKTVDSKSARNKTIQVIMSTLHEKNPREAAHSRRVGELARQLCEAAGFLHLHPSLINTIGFLHDIGKIAIGEEILNKQEPLSDEEFALIKKHPEIGCRILISSYGDSFITEAVLSHHERWDGTGYPNRLKGEDIPLVARIIAVVDSYDAMTSERPYKQTLTPHEAAAEISRSAGTHFDPQLTAIFVEQVLHLDCPSKSCVCAG